jgi:hypothetical protein
METRVSFSISPPETVLPRLGQSLSKEAPARGRTGAIRYPQQTSDRSERREKAGAAGSVPALLQQNLQRLPVTPACWFAAAPTKTADGTGITRTVLAVGSRENLFSRITTAIDLVPFDRV